MPSSSWTTPWLPSLRQQPFRLVCKVQDPAACWQLLQFILALLAGGFGQSAFRTLVAAAGAAPGIRGRGPG